MREGSGSAKSFGRHLHYHSLNLSNSQTSFAFSERPRTEYTKVCTDYPQSSPIPMDTPVRRARGAFHRIARETTSFRSWRDSASAVADPLLTTSYRVSYLLLFIFTQYTFKM